MKTITVIIPCYNAEKYLQQCLQSVIKQSFSDLEIICVNDGSTDNTPQILADYAVKDARLQIITQQNKGISAARNAGLKMATGEYVAFVDGDDWLETDTFEKALTDSTADIICFSYFRNFENGQLPKDLGLEGIFEANYIQRRIIGLVGQELRNMTSFDALITCWGKLYKKEVIAEIRFKDLKNFGTWEDGIFNIEVLGNAATVEVINRPLYHYRKINQGTFTTGYKPGLYLQWKNKFSFISNYIKHHQKPEIFQTALYNRIAVTTLNLAFNEMNSNQSFTEKKANIKKVLNDEVYRNAFKYFEIDKLPPLWKIFYYFAKERNSFAVTAMSSIIYRYVNRKNH